MSEKKHIDRVFQEKLKDLERTPGQSVWEKIDASLNPNKKRRRIIPIWWKLGGIAASLALLITFGILMYNDEKPVVVETKPEENKSLKNIKSITNTDYKRPESTVTSTNNDLEKSNTTKIEESKSNSGQSNTKQKSRFQKADAPFNFKAKKQDIVSGKKQNTGNPLNEVLKDQKENPINKNTKEIIALKEPQETVLIKDADNKITQIEGQNKEVLKPDEKEKESIQEGLALNEDKTDEKEKKPINRWQVNPNIAPVYFNSLGKGSSIDGQFNNNPKSGNINMSYGVSASYALTNKLSVRSGVNLLKISYDTENILALQSLSSNASAQNFRYIKLNSVSNVMFLSANNVSLVHVPNELASNLKAQLNQELGFVEVPLELKYNFIDKKFGINLISGISFLFLSDNNVYSVVNDNKTLVGEATNINSTSFSANFGLGLDYNISKNINLNLDPMFKYQMNTFTDTSGNFKPYIIGIYSGVNIKF